MDPTNVVGRRVGALLIDGLIVAAITAAAWFATTEEVSGACIAGGIEVGGNCRGFTEDSSGRGIFILISLAASLIVYWIMPGLTGTSPGKSALGIRIIARDGGKPGLGRALVRYLMWIVDSFPYIIPYLTGFITALVDDQHRRLGDRVAGTLVVDKSAVGQAPPGGAQQYGQYGGPALGQQPQGQPPQQVPAGVGASAGSTAPGWYDDPHGQARLRYWDGSGWTEHTSN